MKLYYILFLSLFISFSSLAQKAKIENANKKYESLAYIDAIKIYENVADKGYESVELFQKLGNAYYFNADLVTAGKWYEKLFKLEPNVAETEYYFRYSQCLKTLGDYNKANEYLEKFAAKTALDNRAKLFVANKEYLTDIANISNRYLIEDSGINSKASDFGSTVYNNQLIYASAKDSVTIAKYRHTWTNAPFLNLFAATILEDGSLEKPKKFSSTVNSKFHESTPVFSKDGNTMYFTRNNYINGKKGVNDEKFILLKLYKATKEGDNWKNIAELPFTSDQYNTAHPALSNDGKTLYFASDMPGTRGASDIFKVSVNEDGSFGTPVNLGDKINTEARETFPFINDNDELYFASDGHLGLGGLDVFGVKLYEDGTTSKVVNLGSPLNGPYDDFGYYINTTTKIGFFTSNRVKGIGSDDIYKFKEETEIAFECKQVITGTLVDEETQIVIANANVILFDAAMNIVEQTTTDANGAYQFENVGCDTTYFVRGESEEYETVEQSITTPNTSGETQVMLKVAKNIKKVTVGSDLAKTFNIEIIYFDLDKSNIRKDAAVDLAKIVEVMKQNPTMEIDVRSHTDSRQTATYNEKLSSRRAKATVAWMVKNGIQASRITGKGYGESQLVNQCADGVNCTEQEHQANRRSEFIITRM